MNIFQSKFNKPNGSQNYNSEILHEIMGALRDLMQVLAKENNILASGKAEPLKEVIHEKKEYLTKFESLKSRLKYLVRSGELTPEQEALDAIEDIYRKFLKVNRENEVLLKANISAYEKIFEVLRQSAMTAEQTKGSYNKAGGFGNKGVKQSSSTAINVQDEV